MIRDISLPILKKLSFFSISKNDVNKKIAQLIKATKEFLKHNPNIVFTKANKGNITVALNNNGYKSKVL